MSFAVGCGARRRRGGLGLLGSSVLVVGGRQGGFFPCIAQISAETWNFWLRSSFAETEDIEFARDLGDASVTGQTHPYTHMSPASMWTALSAAQVCWGSPPVRTCAWNPPSCALMCEFRAGVGTSGILIMRGGFSRVGFRGPRHPRNEGTSRRLCALVLLKWGQEGEIRGFEAWFSIF